MGKKVKTKTLEQVYEEYGERLPDNVVLAIYLEQANLPQEKVDWYIEQFKKRKAEEAAEALEQQANEKLNITVE